MDETISTKFMKPTSKTSLVASQRVSRSLFHFPNHACLLFSHLTFFIYLLYEYTSIACQLLFVLGNLGLAKRKCKTKGNCFSFWHEPKPILVVSGSFFWWRHLILGLEILIIIFLSFYCGTKIRVYLQLPNFY